MAATSIEWTHLTWNPVTGCDRVSPGCDHCYALTLARRLKAMGLPRYQADGHPATSGPGFALTLHPDTLPLPLSRARPARIFVNSMSDLFHRGVPDEYVAAVFAVMSVTSRHTYQVLTKRHGRMRSLLTSPRFDDLIRQSRETLHAGLGPVADAPWQRYDPDGPHWPLGNVWLGVSAEDQQRADLRVPELAATPAAVRFISAEPLLGPIPSTRMDAIDWLIIGGESGPRARPLDIGWVRELIAAARDAGTPVFVKQLGTAWARRRGLAGKAAQPQDWPADLRVRDYPSLPAAGAGGKEGVR